jgi:putative drug exporter of the RND superfamily
VSTPTDEAPTDVVPPARHAARPFLPRMIRRLSFVVILAWLALTAIVNIVVPQLETVGRERAVSLTPNDAPSMIAMVHIGHVFQEWTSNSSVMVVLEGQQPLGEDAHHFYDQLVERFGQDTAHVQHVQDFWSDPLTAAGSQSSDGKAAYVQLFLAGSQGETLANESVESVRHIVASVAPPAGVKAYVTGPAAMSTDQFTAGDQSLKMITLLTLVVITVVLLFVYRSVVTVLLVLGMVVVELAAARGLVALLGYYEIIKLSTFATNLLTMLAIAASTDYVIFLVGRYQEARSNGEDRESAYYTMFGGIAHVILASGLTIAGATFCLTFTRLPYFQTLGIPLAIGMVVVVSAALTLGSAVVVVASHFGLLEPKVKLRTRGWRRIGTAVVRWPGPILVATIALSLLGLLALPGYRTDYNDGHYLRPDIPANVGLAAAERHFSPARMNPDLLMIETDHDMRNPADFLVIDKVAKAVFAVHGMDLVQGITRPLGTPILHTSIPFQISMQSVPTTMNMQYLQDRMADMDVMADEMQKMIDSMEQMLGLVQQLADTTHDMVGQMHGMVADVEVLRDHIADFDDFFRPLRNYFYWEPHCYDIPVCWAIRSVFDSLDGISTMTDDLQNLLPTMDRLDALMPQMVAILPPIIATMKVMKTLTLTMRSTFGGMQDQMAALNQNASAMGQAFDAAKVDDSFYLPPEAFQNPEMQSGIKKFLSPDGKAVRFTITQQGDPMTPEGISHVEAIRTAATDAIRGTSLAGSTIYLGGTAPMFKDMADGASYDLMVAAIASLGLIFVIMLIITRAVVAAAVIVATVVLSLAASFGLSVLIWQHIVGLPLHWLVLPMVVIILLAVGSDYNLLLVSRFKEEIHAGLKTGIIRAMGGSGSVVTSAGLVFALTMMSMVVSDLKVIAQVGTTIGLGLLFDTLVIRSFMTPSIAALLGRWFWWPQIVRNRPARRQQLTSV